MVLSERTQHAIEACYDAVLAPALWPEALQKLGESVGASSCTFYNRDRGDGLVPMSSGHREFADYWLRNQPHYPDPFPSHATAASNTPWFSRSGRIYLLQHEIMTEEDWTSIPYFHETARPARRDWWAGISLAVADQQWSFTFYRDATRGRFTHPEGQYFASLAPHLSRMVVHSERFADARLAAALSSLEQLDRAAVVIDWHSGVCHLNRRAGDLLCDDFKLVAGRPTALDVASNRRLQNLIASITSTERRDVPLYDQVVIDRARTPWLLVEAMPVTAFGSDVFAAGRAVLMLTELTAPPVADATLLAVVFGLTAAEAKLAARIASGSGIDAAAAALGIHRETARTQLKAAFLKTNTRCQAELVALLSRLRPAAARGGHSGA
jgi:DNA-binding CsgD family transcriptional regulator